MACDIRRCSIEVVRDLCERFHVYESAGGLAVDAFAVYENEEPVAGYAWQPPPPGAAKSVCPEAPQGVLALSRMVAVPKSERRLKHVSKPLREQTKRMIDRTRWPVLVTYSDEGAGHTGYVYQCSGWEKTTRRAAQVFTNASGARASRYSNGGSVANQLTRNGNTWIQRWEHWACPRGKAAEWMADHGWHREEIPGKTWRSGRPAYRYVRR